MVACHAFVMKSAKKTEIHRYPTVLLFGEKEIGEVFPVRKVTRPSSPEPAEKRAIAVTMLRKYKDLFHGPEGVTGLSHLLFESVKRPLTEAESEKAIKEIRALRASK